MFLFFGVVVVVSVMTVVCLLIWRLLYGTQRIFEGTNKYLSFSYTHTRTRANTRSLTTTSNLFLSATALWSVPRCLDPSPTVTWHHYVTTGCQSIPTSHQALWTSIQHEESGTKTDSIYLLQFNKSASSYSQYVSFVYSQTETSTVVFFKDDVRSIRELTFLFNGLLRI